NPGDYDLWAQRGCAGWGWADVLPYFKRAEANAVHGGALHGRDGPLSVEDYAASNPLEELYYEACLERGVPFNPDFNGETQFGCGRYQATVKDGRRWSAADAYLTPALDRPNLTVETGCLALGLAFDGRRCTGVDYLQGRRTRRAEGAEIVLAAGALGSPHLLLLSGIGPAEDLAEHGIDVVADLPGVGRGLLDHVGGAYVEMTVNDPVRWGLVSPPEPEALLRWKADRTGPYGSMFNHCGAFVHMRPGEADPSAQMYFSQTHAERYRGLGAPLAARFSGRVCRSRSEGQVSLATSSPFDKPLVDPRYFSDADDLERTVEITEWNRDLALSKAFAPARAGLTHALSTRAEVEDWVRRSAVTIWHQSSTCRMGADDQAVVGPDLRVRGVDGLRVCDASVMPAMVSANTNAPTIMIAEKGADLIRAP
ncbi:MAG: GMC oxidoreductase, partial [Pseudomonadota bacterium]